jgi:hypothetical protein
MIVCNVSTHIPLICRLSPPHYKAVTPEKGPIQKLILTPAVSEVLQYVMMMMVTKRKLLRLLLSHVLVLLELSGLTAWYSGSALDLYLRCAWFESQLKHQLS